MIHLVADANIVGLDALPGSEVRVTALPGRQLENAHLIDADALWVRSVTRVDEALVRGTALKFVGTATAGLDHVDIDALGALGIPFAAAPGANANAVVEYVLCALAQQREPWERLDRGERLAIIGCGHVGQLLARVAGELGWSYCLCDPWVEAQAAGAAPGAQGGAAPQLPGGGFVSLHEALQASVISLHCSLHQRSPWPSRHLIDTAALDALRGSQWLLNAARGAVIDNGALLGHLQGRDPVNLVLDVWEEEPAFDDSLLRTPTLAIGTPHIAGYSWDAKWKATQMLFEAMRGRGLVSGAMAACPTPLPSVDPPADAGNAPGSDAVEGGAGMTAGRAAGRDARREAESGSGAGAAHALLSQRYRIRDDDQSMRLLVGMGPPQRAEAFDRLRREYPQRRELRGSTMITPVSGSPNLERLLRAFGVHF